MWNYPGSMEAKTPDGSIYETMGEGWSVFGVNNGIVFEGETADSNETLVRIVYDPGSDVALNLPATSGALVGSTLTTNTTDAANSVWMVSGGLAAEGSTANDYETTVTFTNPTADRTVTVANGSGTVFLSALATNAPDAANSIWGISGGFTAEGSSVDANETSVTFTNPTADRSVVFADGAGTVVLSTLATNAPDAANSVWGASNGLVLEGSTANDYEQTVTTANVTADRTATLPDASGTVMLSTLTTNAPDAANAVTGASGGLVYEGSAVDDYETTVTATNSTADRTVTLADASGTVMLSSLATNAPDAANAVTGASNAVVYEGSAADANELSITASNPTADRTVTWPDASGVPILATAAPDAANAVWGVSNGLSAEGSAADGNETTISFTNPTADRSVVFGDGAGTVMLSSLATNVPNAANAVTGASNGLVYEGSSADANETTVTAANPTADRTVTLADASGTVMLSALATNAPDIANSVWGVSGGLKAEGSSADANETAVTFTNPTAARTVTLADASGTVFLLALATNGPDAANAVWGVSGGLTAEGSSADGNEVAVTFTNPTADRSVVFGDGAGTVMLSSLATNVPDAANAVTGASNGLVYEGSAADANETTLTSTNPTADRTITIPDASGTVVLIGTATHSYGALHADWTLTAAEASASFITVSDANDAVNAILPAAQAGKVWTVYNGSGQTLTIKVTGQSGASLANSKVGVYTCTATDVVEIFEQS